MANIKKKDGDSWKVVASNRATGISSTNPKLIEEDTPAVSVDKVLERHQEDIELLQRNVAWLALNGGGGPGGGGGGGTVTEATCNISVNGVLTGGQAIIDNSGLQIVLNDISATTSKPWTVIVRVGVTQVAQSKASYSNPTIFIPLSSISKYLTNHTGNLYIGSSYEDDANAIYGSSSWSGTIVENIVNVSTINSSVAVDTLTESQLTYQYSVGIVGKYTLNINVLKGSIPYNTLNYDVSITSTVPQTKTIPITELLDLNGSEEDTSIVGVYTLEAVLTYNDNYVVTGSTTSTVTVVTDSILVSTTKMSTDINNPIEISISSSINVVFTAYLQGANTFKYNYYIGDEKVKSDSIGSFGKEVNDYIPVSNKDWAVVGDLVPLKLEIIAGDASTIETYYIRFTEAVDALLDIDSSSKERMISNFVSGTYSNGINSFNLEHTGYSNGGSSYTIKSDLKIHNANNISVTNRDPNTTPYLRVSNGSYGILDNWTFNNRSYSLKNLLSTEQFTISLCFKADYHPDDYRTILYSGTVNNATGAMIKGISIDVHDIYINNTSKVALTDNEVNSVDITCTKTIVDDKVGGVIVDKVVYIIKIYLDGVLTAVSQEDNFIELGDVIYLGSRVYDSSITNTEISDYLCDCNIYNLQLYDTALTDYDIMINYINNLASTNYINGLPDYSIIDTELKNNFCERGEGGAVTSYMFKNGQYSIDFLLDGSSNLDYDNLTDYAKVLGIPIMLIDVSNDSEWTFNAFVTQQTSGEVSLKDTTGKTIQYWDPTGTNDTILKINNSTIGLQGTSTLADAVKNLNITVPNNTAFIPKDTWLPEQTYTLKADVVDSSHSNNASIGNFINNILGYNKDTGESFYPLSNEAKANVYQSDYVKNQHTSATLKNTVEGFPVFLIMKFNTNENSPVSVTSLGIYSFNLGRDAYRNLGFKKLNSLKDNVGEAPVITNFPYLLEEAVFNDSESEANWIEINDTTSIEDLVDVTSSFPEGFDSAKGDFWQDDDNILNARYSLRYPTSGNPADYSNFKTFVGNIMQLPVEGTFVTDSVGNVDRKQITTAYDLYTVDTSKNYSKTGEQQTITTDANILPKDLGFNSESMYKYFCIGLLFGLIDNFGKNSTYRSWNNGAYYIGFYDLDCALGGGNQGQLDITPDLWIKYLTNNLVEDKSYGYLGETFNKELYGDHPEPYEIVSGTVVSANHNKLWLSLDTPFYRGYSNNSSINSIYTKYWYELRIALDEISSEAGYDNFADYFIDNFYVNQTKNCGVLIFNYDYKLKYLLQFTDDTYNNTKDLTKLHGRKIAYARDWLKKHIIFLDSLFYWRDSSQTPLFKNDLNSKGSNTVYNTPDAFPMKSNTSMIMYNSVGNTTQTYYFLSKNREMFINAGSNSSNSALNWNFTNSPNIIELGNSENPLSSMNVNILSFTPNAANLNNNGYPSITELNLQNNKIFGSGFNLNAFTQGDLSELRTINFNNTSGNSFNLNLTSTDSHGDVYTKYSKLTSIDISNSTCVSDLDIPTTPLTTLKVANSSITNLELEGQKYLKNVDVTGCTNLLTILIDECDSYTDFTISNLTNLKEVKILNCPNITNINISNCPSLKLVSIESCESVETISITGCASLTGLASDNYVTLSECGALTSLNLSNNINLTTFRITQCNQANITKLLLNSTSISTITGDGALTSLLDLYAFDSLNNFAIYNNTEVVKIQFANNTTPIYITSTFQQCSNLERIFGNIQLTNSTYSGNYGAFRGCSKFSIHGINTTQWMGNKAIYTNGIVNTPWKMLTNDGDNRADIYGDIDPSDSSVYTELTTRNVTNIRFTNSTSLLQYTFYGTSVTQFDVYYVFFMIAMSGITASLSASFTFGDLETPLFNWEEGNEPNRFMFYGCSAVKSFSNTFTSYPTFWYSPEEGKDNGLFSQLTGLTSIGSMCSSTVVFSKKLFKRTSGNYPLTSFSYTGIKLICDTDTDFSDYDNSNNPTWLATHGDSAGNLDGFFDDIPYLSTLISVFEGIATLNFDTLVFPNSVQYIRGAFNPTYATGTIDLEEMFTEGSSCKEISHSFSVSDFNTGYGPQPTMPIRSTAFSNITGIQIVGYNSAKDNGGNALSTSFSGKGLRKYIADSTFPSSIVESCPALEVFAGFFKNVEAKAFSETPSIPGNMFLNNTVLRNVASMMYNCDITYKLSGNGFRNCPNLSNVSYCFYHDITAEYRSKITGEIPYKLFYHGATTSSKVIKGTNQTEEPDEDFDLTTLGDGTTITFNVYRKNILNMTRCFYGCVGLDYYTNEAGVSYTEGNSLYAPYKWIYNEETETWSQGYEDSADFKAKETDASWGYTGNPSTKNSSYGYYELGTPTLVTNNTISGKSETLNYMCSPDLLRYCSNSPSLTVDGLFENCGLNYSVNTSGYMTTEENYYSTGIQGRIPPYLLQPISNVTNVSRMFKNCRRISSYVKESTIYQIPLEFFSYTPKVNNLIQTFQGLSLVFNTSLNVFTTLVANLDIRCILSSVLYGTSTGSGTWTISNLFTTNSISKISGAFSIKELIISDNTELGVAYQTFGNIGISDSVQVNTTNFSSSKIPSSNSTGYVYYGWGDNASDTLIGTSNNNYN